MSVQTLRPNASAGNTGGLTGGATAHAVLSDDSDASYVTYSGGQSTTLNLPAASFSGVFLGASIRARCAKVSASASLANYTWDTGEPEAQITVTWTSPTTATLGGSDQWISVETLFETPLVLTGPDNAVRVHELYVDVLYAAPPVVTVTAPSGTVSDTNEPVVRWSNALDGDGGSQTHHHVKVFSSAQFTAGGFDPATSAAVYGTVAVADAGQAVLVKPSLADGSYRAYVRSAQTVNGAQNWSAWAFSAFTVSVVLPAVPSLTLTAEPGSGRIKIELTEG